MTEIKPCVFCRSEQVRLLSRRFMDHDPEFAYSVYWVECCGCNATGPRSASKEHAIYLWIQSESYTPPSRQP